MISLFLVRPGAPMAKLLESKANVLSELGFPLSDGRGL